MQEDTGVIVAVDVKDVREAQEKCVNKDIGVLVNAEPGWFDEETFIPFGFYDWYLKALDSKEIILRVPITAVKMVKTTFGYVSLTPRAHLDRVPMVNCFISDTKISIMNNSCRVENAEGKTNYRQVITDDGETKWVMTSTVRTVTLPLPDGAVPLRLFDIIDKVNSPLYFLKKKLKKYLTSPQTRTATFTTIDSKTLDKMLQRCHMLIMKIEFPKPGFWSYIQGEEEFIRSNLAYFKHAINITKLIKAETELLFEDVERQDREYEQIFSNIDRLVTQLEEMVALWATLS